MIEHTGFLFCPRCGKRPLAQLDANAIRCTRCHFEYFHNCASCVAAIIETRGGIVLTVRDNMPKKGKLDLPGGFCNYGESLEDTLVREVKEETGLDIADVAYMGSFPNMYRYKTVTYFTTDTIFTCTTPDISIAAPGEEIAAIRIVKPGTLAMARVGFPSARAALTQYRRSRSSKLKVKS